MPTTAVVFFPKAKQRLYAWSVYFCQAIFSSTFTLRIMSHDTKYGHYICVSLARSAASCMATLVFPLCFH